MNKYILILMCIVMVSGCNKSVDAQSSNNEELTASGSSFCATEFIIKIPEYTVIRTVNGDEKEIVSDEELLSKMDARDFAMANFLFNDLVRGDKTIEYIFDEINKKRCRED